MGSSLVLPLVTHPSHSRNLSPPVRHACVPEGPRGAQDRFFLSPYNAHESLSLGLNAPISFFPPHPLVPSHVPRGPPQPTGLPSDHLLQGRSSEQTLVSVVSPHSTGQHPIKAQGLTKQNIPPTTDVHSIPPPWVPPHSQASNLQGSPQDPASGVRVRI